MLDESAWWKTADRPDAERGGPVPWGLAISAGAGLVIGLGLGAWNQSLGNAFEGGLPRNFGATVMTALTIGGMLVLGFLLLLPGATRPLGAALLIAAPCAVAGFLVAGAVVPAFPGAQELNGSVRVQLSSPVTQTLEASARCTTPSAPDRGFFVESALGRVGANDLQLNLVVFRGQATASLQVHVDGRPGYAGSAPISNVMEGLRAGHATFTGLSSSNGWIAGAQGSLLSGTLSWDCGSG